MSVQRQSVPPKDSSAASDLETTAELPVLDVAAYEAAVTEERSGSTDTWHMPAPNAQALQAAAAASSAAAAAAEDRSLQLETDLRALAENLRDVEERLNRRGERLIELERELASSRAERVALDQRASALVSEAEARAASAIREAGRARQGSDHWRASSCAQSRVEGHRARKNAPLLSSPLLTNARLSLVTAAEARATTAAADLNAARAELATAQSRAAALQASLEERSGTVSKLESVKQERRRAARHARTRARRLSQLSSIALETRATQYFETLQTLEGRRNIFDGQLLGLDGDVGSRDAQITDLQQQLIAQTHRAARAASELAARTKRVESLEREVSSLAGLARPAQRRSGAVRPHQLETSGVGAVVDRYAGCPSRAHQSPRSVRPPRTERNARRAEHKQIETLTRERDKQAQDCRA